MSKKPRRLSISVDMLDSVVRLEDGSARRKAEKVR